MNLKIYEFDAVIRKVEGLDRAYIKFPWDVRLWERTVEKKR